MQFHYSTRVAYHEAGHAVFYALTGIPLGFVLIHKTPAVIVLRDATGRERRLFQHGVCVPSKAGPRQTGGRYGQARAMLYLAGPVAQAMADTVPSQWALWRECPPDAFSIVLDELWGGASDTALVWKIVRSLACGEPEQHQLFQHFRCQTDAILSNPAVWAAVRAVAEALLARGRLSGTTVQRIVRTHLPSSADRHSIRNTLLGRQPRTLALAV